MPVTHHLLRLRLFCIALLMTAATACSMPNPALQGEDHPLVGKIWDTRQQAFIPPSERLRQLHHAEYLLLGERHDNPVHHRHQAWFIRQLRRYQPQASVAFEMIDQQQGERLAQVSIGSTRQLLDILSQDDPGWHYEQYYREVFRAVIEAGYPILAANMNRQQLMQNIRAGEANLSPAYQRLLNAVPLSEIQSHNLHREIRRSHCDLLNDKAIDSMVRAQRLRDVVMAETLRSSSQPVKILIAGNGHVRKDRGVPIYLDGQARQLAVGFVEVQPGQYQPQDYQSAWDNDRLPFDLVWFTPRVERGDPCERLRQQMQGHNKPANN